MIAAALILLLSALPSSPDGAAQRGGDEISRTRPAPETRDDAAGARPDPQRPPREGPPDIRPAPKVEPRTEKSGSGDDPDEAMLRDLDVLENLNLLENLELFDTAGER